MSLFIWIVVSWALLVVYLVGARTTFACFPADVATSRMWKNIKHEGCEHCKDGTVRGGFGYGYCVHHDHNTDKAIPSIVVALKRGTAMTVILSVIWPITAAFYLASLVFRSASWAARHLGRPTVAVVSLLPSERAYQAQVDQERLAALEKELGVGDDDPKAPEEVSSKAIEVLLLPPLLWETTTTTTTPNAFYEMEKR